MATRVTFIKIQEFLKAQDITISKTEKAKHYNVKDANDIEYHIHFKTTLTKMMVEIENDVAKFIRKYDVNSVQKAAGSQKEAKKMAKANKTVVDKLEKAMTDVTLKILSMNLVRHSPEHKALSVVQHELYYKLADLGQRQDHRI